MRSWLFEARRATPGGSFRDTSSGPVCVQSEHPNESFGYLLVQHQIERDRLHG